jgi:Domain of unknown function (DUF4365)
VVPTRRAAGIVAKKHTARAKQAKGKKRTREHVIADLSVVHVQYFIANAGFSSEATSKDYGYDLTVNTFDRDGLIDPLAILIQLKASEKLKLSLDSDGASYWFNLDIRDYNLWIKESNSVFLILYEASSMRAYWLYFQRCVSSKHAPKPKKDAKTICVKIPRVNRVKTSFFRHARHLKEQVLAKLGGVDLHG